MTDGQPRQLLPETESHQNLSSKLGVSRPPPPRSRSKQASSAAKASLSRSNSSEAADTVGVSAQDGDLLGNSHDSQATARSSDEDRGDLEARGTASPVRMTAQRVVSSSSIRSTRSTSAAPDIPKEEIEKALEGLDRDDLVVALGRAKVQMDEIEARLDEQVLENETLHDSASSLAQQLGEAEVQVHSLQSLVKQREERIDEMMAEQDRMEGEVYSTMQVIERLRKQLGETERGRNDAEKRYLDQTATMDKERQYYMDTQALLKSQKATQAAAYEKLLSGHNQLLREHEHLTNKLASIKAGGATADADSSLPTERNLTAGETGSSQDENLDTGLDATREGLESSNDSASSAQDRRKASKSTTFAQEQDTAALIEELSTLQKSHSSMSETMATLQAELKDVRAENVTLRDQNETFMDILQEKTFSGALLNESAMLRGLRRASLGRLHAQNGLEGPYDEDYSTEADSIDIDDEDDENRTGNTSLSSGTIPEEDEDDVDDVPDTPRALPKETKGNRRRRASSSAAHATTDLASELEGTRTDVTSPKNQGREEKRSQRVGVVSDNVDELQKEVRELREANQALTLYISKIIDRIIAKEGYENILAIESRGSVRGLHNKASRARLSGSMRQIKPSADDEAGSRKISNSNQASDASASSGTSGSLFRFGSGSSQAASSSRPSAPPKSRRTGSIDWRNLPFIGGGGSNNSSASTNPKMRPLTLQSDNLLIPLRDGSARKVRTSEEIEDDNDVAERERIRQELLMRGIEPPKHQLVQSPVSPRKQRPQSMSVAPGAGGFAAFFSRVVGGATANTALSPGGSQASTTPGRSNDAGFERPLSSTPAVDSGKRDEERNRALQLSEGSGSSLTKSSGGQGIASKARQLRAERHQQTLDLAADTAGYPFPVSSESSRVTSGANSFTDSSILENSVAGDESYCLPVPPRGGGGGGDVDSPLIGYGASLPPLPTETTGDEDPDAYSSPTLTQNKTMPQTSQDQGWKRALRRISLLSTTSAGSQPVGQDAAENGLVASPASEMQPSPAAETGPESVTEANVDK